MLFSRVTALLALSGYVSAKPAPAAAMTDAEILNYILSLEHLQNAFYREGLRKFSKAEVIRAGYDEVVYDDIRRVSSDESAHVSFLTAALKAAGVHPVAACTYDFGCKDVKSFFDMAILLEDLGVSAYLGAAANILNNTDLTAAGSILTAEARHSSYFRSRYSAFFASRLERVFCAQPFDTPLRIVDSYSLASRFIVSCPESNPSLPSKSYAALKLDHKTTLPVRAGDTVRLLAPSYLTGGGIGYVTLYGAFLALGGPKFVDVKPRRDGFDVKIPDGCFGQTYVALTYHKTAMSENTVAAGPAIIEISNKPVPG